MSETAEEPDEVDSILAQSVKTTEEGSDPKTWYITCFSEDGIWCKKFTEGQEGEDLWRMEFTDPSQYQKVLNYLQSFAEGKKFRMQRKRTSGEDSLRKTHGRSGVNQDFSDIPEETFRKLF